MESPEPGSSTRSGPPPRPPIAVRPLNVAGSETRPVLLLVSAVLWLLSGLLAIPTAIYAAGRFEENSVALFEDMAKDIDPQDLENARAITDALPKGVTAVVLMLVVFQLGLVAVLIVRHSRAARGLLAGLAVVEILVLAAWYYVTFTDNDAAHEAILALQAVLLVAGAASMFGDRQTRWLTADSATRK
ncbi:hypothetical protein [Antrihabitans sp. YC2-6]|uniref:hypothetical protein n=1 Tax=Antrihabitans sp. YC2-6 TaxID=2799498 RepID=UPI0018F5EC5A|nr:hypothetical protein [Antrihabitans sp. YC2-6]MBJ8346461.1 hypothetical protein [Antrihabitans sp. YC2-6]